MYAHIHTHRSTQYISCMWLNSVTITSNLLNWLSNCLSFSDQPSMTSTSSNCRLFLCSTPQPVTDPTWQSKRAAVWRLHTLPAQHTVLYSVFCHSVSDGICSRRNLQSSSFIHELCFTIGIEYIFPDGYLCCFQLSVITKYAALYKISNTHK